MVGDPMTSGEDRVPTGAAATPDPGAERRVAESDARGTERSAAHPAVASGTRSASSRSTERSSSEATSAAGRSAPAPERTSTRPAPPSESTEASAAPRTSQGAGRPAAGPGRRGPGTRHRPTSSPHCRRDQAHELRRRARDGNRPCGQRMRRSDPVPQTSARRSSCPPPGWTPPSCRVWRTTDSSSRGAGEVNPSMDRTRSRWATSPSGTPRWASSHVTCECTRSRPSARPGSSNNSWCPSSSSAIRRARPRRRTCRQSCRQLGAGLHAALLRRELGSELGR